MKKQLLIAAVAATMTSVAMADISITGGMKVNSTTTEINGGNTNAITHEADLKVSGKTGGSEFYMELNNDSADGLATASSTAGSQGGNFDVEDIWMKTSIEGVTVKAGTWNGSDSIVSRDSDRGLGKYALSGTVAGVGVLFEGQGNGQGSTGTTLTGTVGGVALTYKNESHQDQFKASGSIQGLNYSLHHVDADASASDKNSAEFSYDLNGYVLSYAQADAETNATIDGDSYFGNAATMTIAADGTGMATNDDVRGFGVKTDVIGNTVSAKFITVDDSSASKDVDITKVVVTRPLAMGTTLEVTYTDSDNSTASLDKESFDVELAVKF